MNPTKPVPLTQRADLTSIVAGVLGDMAFMISDQEATALPAGVLWLQCEIDYRGPATGKLRCWCTRNFAVQLAANLLGVERDDGSALVGAEDAVRELMNVLCGQLATAWYGTEAMFRLSIPVVRESVDPPPLEEQAGNACRLSVTEEPFFCFHQLNP